MALEKIDYPISNRYTFASVFSVPENVRPLLESVLGVSVGDIRIVEPEHSSVPTFQGRGVRMDVFVEDGKGTVYDVEMQNTNQGDLELRSRYLLSLFDRERIRRGDDYMELGSSVVIFICDFDPIGLDDRMYVVKPTVLDRWHVFDDGTSRVFLNARGASKDEALREKLGNAHLAALLSYMDGGDTMGDEWVAQLDRDVRAFNADEGWRTTVLGLELDYNHARHLAQKEGRARGLAEGRGAGLAEGREAGLAEGREAGLAEAERIEKCLVDALSAAGRLQELPDALRDPQAKARLLKEFGIA